MAQNSFLTLSQLFDSIGIIEKGIEKLYHYLLQNKNIENLKKVCEEFNLTLKRGYKIASVLSDLELAQIYDRPMKIALTTPLIPIWQRIINARIEALANEFQEKKNKCENALEEFLNNYNLKEEVSQEPVEFLSYSVDNFTEMFYPFSAKLECKIALGIHYDNPLVIMLQEKGMGNIPEDFKNSLSMSMIETKENLKKINIKVIFNSEVIETLVSSKVFTMLEEHFKKIDLKFQSLEVRVTDEDFSNFSLIDDELIQPSFDPKNVLIGAYISRNKNIYHIFNDKFDELFEGGMPINEYLKENKELKIEPLSKTQLYTLCLL